MLSKANALLQLARTYGQRFFLHFGIHCATHQIRVILISSVVITSLFYPALASYYSSPDSTWSVLTNFVGSYSAIPNSNDIVDVWSGFSSLQIREDRISKLSCGSGRTLRVERLLIQSPVKNDDSALNQAILFRTLDFQNALENIIQSRQVPCLKGGGPNQSCFSLSPLAFWNFDKDILADDPNILDTLALSRNATVSGVAINPTMVLAGRGSLEHHATPGHFDYASYLVLTYFFDSDCLSKSEHVTWLEAVREAVSSSDEVTVYSEIPALVVLEYKSRPQGWTALSFILGLAYGGFILYVLWSMRRVKAVHSRIGLTFTALVEIAVSTITSMSLLLLVGFKITLVPWELLPVVIVVVGAENMSNLVDAVTSTPVTIAVKDRIAQGLSRAGTSNSLKLITYNSILGVIAFFSVGATRQFCVFAIVVLVAHWFLAHTFFVTVLSIDLARLELGELLRQDVNSNSSVSPSLRIEQDHKQREVPEKHTIISKARNILTSRATKNISLVLLLTIIATLYYLTYPSHLHLDPAKSSMIPKGALSRIQNNTRTTSQLPSEKKLWAVFNPHEEAPLHLRIEPPVLITFHQNQPPISDQKEHHKPRQHRLHIRTIQMLWWTFKIMVLPIALTTTALWIFTIYLLKDTERLDVPRLKAHDDEEGVDPETSLEDKMHFTTIPRAYTSNVELIASNRDGKVIASVGLLNELVIHWVESQQLMNLPIDPVIQRSASTSAAAASTIVAVALDPDGRFCAVGTGAGVVAIWSISEKSSRFLTAFAVEDSSASVSEVRFLPEATIRGSNTNPDHSPVILASYENGMVVRFCNGEKSIVLPGSHPCIGLLRATFLPHDPSKGSFLVSFLFDDGTVDLVDPTTSVQVSSITVNAENDRVSLLHACQAANHDPLHFVLATATETGRISVWDLRSGELLACLDESYLRISQLRIFANGSQTCHVCGQPFPESYTLALSMGGVLQTFTVIPANDSLTMQCSCVHARPRAISSSVRHSRSGSVSSTMPGSPSILRKKLSMTFEGSSFPVSGHGLHSRRASEKEGSRRASETFNGIDDCDTRRLNVELLGPHGVRRGACKLIWEMDLQRGAWDVSQGYLVGIRRITKDHHRHRRHCRPDQPDGLSWATLERWEAWRYNPISDIHASSTLASLCSYAPSGPSPSKNQIPRLPFTRIVPFFSHSSYSLSGLGNTVGVLRNL